MAPIPDSLKLSVTCPQNFSDFIPNYGYVVTIGRCFGLGAVAGSRREFRGPRLISLVPIQILLRGVAAACVERNILKDQTKTRKT